MWSDVVDASSKETGRLQVVGNKTKDVVAVGNRAMSEIASCFMMMNVVYLCSVLDRVVRSYGIFLVLMLSLIALFASALLGCLGTRARGIS